MAESLKDKTVNGIIWSAIERFSVQGVLFIVTLILARILEPKDFGLIGMLTIFIAVSQSLIDSGFSQALIRKQERTETDNCTVFFFNIVVSLFLYGLLFLIAPWVASFYKEPQLCDLMRVLCLILIVNSFAVVQRAIYSAVIDFKTQARASFLSAFLSGGVGVIMALKGCGVWSLVFQQISNALFNTAFLWFYSNWHPKLLYSWESFKTLFSFGSKLMISGLLDTLYNNMFTLVVGKAFSAEALGHYTQANRFAQLPSSNIASIMQRVTFPVLCSIQDDDDRLRANFRKLLKLFAFIIFPLMCVLAGISSPLVDCLLGEKWHFTAILIIPMCFDLMWWPIHALNLNILKVKGRSDLFLKLEIVKKIIGVAIILLSIRYGLVFMCYISIAASLFGLVLNTYYTKKLINVSLFLQLKDLAPTLALSLTTFVIVFFVSGFFAQNYIQVIVGVLTGCLYYLGIVAIFKPAKYIYLKEIVSLYYIKYLKK